MSKNKRKGAWFTTTLIGDTKIHIHESELDEYLEAEGKIGCALLIIAFIILLFSFFIPYGKYLKKQAAENYKTPEQIEMERRELERSFYR